jgi:branched-chain amino acid transport system substrate-binding protein
MSKKAFSVMAVIIVLTMLVSACAPAAPATPAAPAAPATAAAPVAPAATEAKQLPDEIVVGVLEPLTGSYAVFGTNAEFAVELAVKDINDAGGIKSMGGKKIKLVVQDTGDSVDSAKLGMESIISKNHPVAIIGSYVSRWTISLSEITDREKVIYVTDGVVPDVTKQGRQYIFRPSATVNQYGTMAYRFVKETAAANNIPINTVAILNEDSLFGRMSSLAITGAVLADKIKVVSTIEYAYDLTDATPIIQQLKAANPDVIFQTPYYNDGILFAKGYKEMGFYPKFIQASGGSGFVDPQSVAAEGDAAEGLAMAFCYSPDKNTPQNQKFVKEFVAAKGFVPTEAAGGGYMDMMTLYEALELTGKSHADDPLKPENLRDAFLNLNLTSGPAAEVIPSGKIKFSATGDNDLADATIMQVQNGKTVTVFPPEIAVAKPIFPNPHYKP